MYENGKVFSFPSLKNLYVVIFMLWDNSPNLLADTTVHCCRTSPWETSCGFFLGMYAFTFSNRKSKGVGADKVCFVDLDYRSLFCYKNYGITMV